MHSMFNCNSILHTDTLIQSADAFPFQSLNETVRQPLVDRIVDGFRESADGLSAYQTYGPTKHPVTPATVPEAEILSVRCSRVASETLAIPMLVSELQLQAGRACDGSTQLLK